MAVGSAREQRVRELVGDPAHRPVRHPRLSLQRAHHPHRRGLLWVTDLTFVATWTPSFRGRSKQVRTTRRDRAGVRRFAARFAGQSLEVALEATTGRRFVVEEFQNIGAEVHLAEPAETAARRGTKKRAKSDRADARHLRELLMVGRLPESWIPPEHLLDLGAQVRLRHTLVDQGREWQQRIHAVLYHHGVPARSYLLGSAARQWLARILHDASASAGAEALFLSG